MLLSWPSSPQSEIPARDHHGLVLRDSSLHVGWGQERLCHKGLSDAVSLPVDAAPPGASSQPVRMKAVPVVTLFRDGFAPPRKIRLPFPLPTLGVQQPTLGVQQPDLQGEK